MTPFRSMPPAAMSPGAQRSAFAARAVTAARNPYQLERALGVLLWLALFAVLFSLGD